MRFKTAFAVTVCALLLLAAVSIASADPVLVWQEAQTAPNILGGPRGNIYYGGGVFDDTWYTSQLEYGPMQWGMTQKNGTALLNSINANAGTMDNGLGKSCTKIGKWIFCAKSTKGLVRAIPWDGTTITDLANSGPESCATDGTNLYTNDYNTKNMVCKYQIGADGSATKVWSTLIGTSAIRIRGVSYYNGKVYAADHNATDRGVYELDAETGVATKIATYPAFSGGANAYQVVRYGNQIFGVGLDRLLQVFEFDGTTWNLAHSYSLGLTDEYGIGVKGDGTKAQFLWISSLGNTIDASISKQVSFWALDPTSAPEAKLGTSKNAPDGTFVTFKDLVCSFVGDKEFFAQDKDRSAGIRVQWKGDMPSRDALVTVTGLMSTNAGERFLQALSVTPGSEYKAKSVGMPTRSAFAKYQPGSAGLGNDSLLVTVWGRITAVDWVDYSNFYLDDGSKVTNDTPIPTHFINDKVAGIKVVKYSKTTIAYPDVTEMPYVSATGIVRMQNVNGQVIPVLYLRDDNDITWRAR